MRRNTFLSAIICGAVGAAIASFATFWLINREMGYVLRMEADSQLRTLQVALKLIREDPMLAEKHLEGSVRLEETKIQAFDDIANGVSQ